MKLKLGLSKGANLAKMGMLGGGGAGDAIAPTVVITSTAANITSGAFTCTFTLSEASVDFAVGDITVGNGTAGIFAGSGMSYTAVITPTADGVVTVDVAANAFHDAAGNGNIAATQFSIINLSTLGIWVRSDQGLWTDAGKTTAATADGDLIYTWANKKAAGADFVQATSGNRPKLKIVSGIPYVRLEDSTDVLSAAISADASQTIFILAKKLTSPSASRLYLQSFGGTTFTGVYTNSGVGGNGFTMSTDTPEQPIGGTATNMNVISTVYAATNSCVARINGAGAVTFDVYDAYASKTAITLGLPNASGDYDFMEVIQCTSALDDTTRAAVEAYLTTRNPT